MKRREQGSALVEALIGTAIVALTVGVMYRAIIDSTARGRMAEEKRFAGLIAQSQLSSVGVTIPVEPGINSGIEAGFGWRVQIEPYTGPSVPSKIGSLWRVTVSVSNPKGRQLVALSTLALAKGS